MSEPLEIGEDLAIHDAKGRKLVDIGLRATLYFRNGHTLQSRRAVADCFDEFHAMAQAHLRWTIPSDLRVKGESLEQAASRMVVDLTSPGFDEDDGWEFIWHAGEDVGSASNLSIQAYGAKAWQAGPPHNDVSFLSVAFPLTFFADRPTGLPTLVGQWAERLGAVHGYGGVGMCITPDRFAFGRIGSAVVGLAMRFPGIELDVPTSHSLWCKEHIKGVNWLTVLSDALAMTIGGGEGLRRTLGPPFEVIGHKGGLVIKAGHVPQIGDRNRQVRVELYERLAHLLKPIRIAMHGPIQQIPREDVEAWLFRFDR